MKRPAILVLVIALAVLVEVGTAWLPQANPNAFFALYPLELLGVLVFGLVALSHLFTHPGCAAGLLGAGVYTLLMGAAFVTLEPIWGGSDDAFLGFAPLGGLAVLMGTNLAVGSALVLGGTRPQRALNLGFAAGLVAGLLTTAAGLVYPLMAVRAPLLIALLVLVVVAVALRCAGRRQLVTLLARPLGLAALGVAITLALLLIRGPSDWSSNSTTVKLYSFPLFVLGVAITLALHDLGLSATDRGTTNPSEEPSEERQGMSITHDRQPG